MAAIDLIVLGMVKGTLKRLRHPKAGGVPQHIPLGQDQHPIHL